ncbi:hypothetical protein I302_103947 [Kwoniella bestiolae CBS 10118]|uniref:BTB domain-containing protein n=1 Tax=Kwoniella bestiolae CBS 10118 TaxID=1296100 RepID=A0A1B9G9T9_9TREE|nr:hypothetical protein I302_02653 [Kwoniella bestiolae CBS 10118]OCF27804.1 hypothetical protein I302_02653 [Kwoniella bestiolae CBS 10118]
MGNQDTTTEYHSTYNDPRDEVVIRSSDNIHFRASRHKLMRVSTFFKDILDIRPVDHSEPIPLEFTSEVIIIFLDAISTSTVQIPYLEVKTAKSLLNLCNFLMSDSIQSSVTDKVIEIYLSVPFELLEIASSVNDVTLAQKALSAFDTNIVRFRLIPDSSDNFKSVGMDQLLDYLKRLRPSFQLSILHELLKPGQLFPNHKSIDRLVFVMEIDWKSLSDSFDPSQFE